MGAVGIATADQSLDQARMVVLRDAAGVSAERVDLLTTAAAPGRRTRPRHRGPFVSEVAG